MIFKEFIDSSKKLFTILKEKKHLTEEKMAWIKSYEKLVENYEENKALTEIEKEDVIILRWWTNRSSGKKIFYFKHPKSLENKT